MKLLKRSWDEFEAAEVAGIVEGLIARHGGVNGLTGVMERRGLQAMVRSWIDSGPNQPISVDQLHQLFGTDAIRAMAAKAGMHPRDFALKLSVLLPKAIDWATPIGS